MKLLVFFLLSVCVLVSCKKKYTKIIHISAKNIVTNAPYPNLSYTIWEEKLGTDEPIKIVRSGTLDENGKANFEMYLAKNSSYELKLDRPANNCYDNHANNYTGKGNPIYFAYHYNSFDFDFEFAPCAYLKRNVVNTNCFDSNDEIKLYTSSLQGWINHGFSKGCTAYYDADYTALPMGQYNYKWIVTKNNIKDTFYDSFYLDEGAYRTYDLNW